MCTNITIRSLAEEIRCKYELGDRKWFDKYHHILKQNPEEFAELEQNPEEFAELEQNPEEFTELEQNPKKFTEYKVKKLITQAEKLFSSSQFKNLLPCTKNKGPEVHVKTKELTIYLLIQFLDTNSVWSQLNNTNRSEYQQYCDSNYTDVIEAFEFFYDFVIDWAYSKYLEYYDISPDEYDEILDKAYNDDQNESPSVQFLKKDEQNKRTLNKKSRKYQLSSLSLPLLPLEEAERAFAQKDYEAFEKEILPLHPDWEKDKWIHFLNYLWDKSPIDNSNYIDLKSLIFNTKEYMHYEYCKTLQRLDECTTILKKWAFNNPDELVQTVRIDYLNHTLDALIDGLEIAHAEELE